MLSIIPDKLMDQCRNKKKKKKIKENLPWKQSLQLDSE